MFKEKGQFLYIHNAFIKFLFKKIQEEHSSSKLGFRFFKYLKIYLDLVIDIWKKNFLYCVKYLIDLYQHMNLFN